MVIDNNNKDNYDVLENNDDDRKREASMKDSNNINNNDKCNDNVEKTITMIEGLILRKKKRKYFLVLAVQTEQQSKSIPVYIPLQYYNEHLKYILVIQSYVRFYGTYSTNIPSEEIRDNEQRFLVTCTTTNTTIDNNNNDNESVIIANIELIRTAPDPKCIPYIIQQVQQEKLSITTLLPKHYTEEQYESLIQEKLPILIEKPYKQSYIIPQIIRTLQGKNEIPNPKQRIPSVRRYDMDILRDMEQRIQLLPIHKVNDGCTNNIQYNGNSNNNHDNNSILQSILLCNNNNNYLNLPENSHDAISAHGKLTRKEYLVNKKFPQIQYFINKINNLYYDKDNNKNTNNKTIKNIVDIGGGRGDLSIALAAESNKEYNITMIDCNESSIIAAKEYIQQQQEHFNDPTNIQERVNFILTKDFIHDIIVDDDDNNNNNNNKLQQVDLVIALHACGDLSDAAIQYAISHNSAFIICPCCYSKRFNKKFIPLHYKYYEQKQYINDADDDNNNNNIHTDNNDNNNNNDNGNDKAATHKNTKLSTNHNTTSTTKVLQVLGRLAELNERPDIGKRAIHIINSMRLNAIKIQQQEQKYSKLYLEEYDPNCSSRNMVLIGIPENK